MNEISNKDAKLQVQTMTSNPKFPRAEALAVADEIMDALRPGSKRIEIAGSLRRGKAEAGDVEVLYVPRVVMADDCSTLFGDKMAVNGAEEEIKRLLFTGVLGKRVNAADQVTWGAKNKLAWHLKTGIGVDLFATIEDNWYTSLVVRTGGLETNLRLTRAANERGRSLLAYGCGVRMGDGDVVRADSERMVFELCGVPYLPPEARP